MRASPSSLNHIVQRCVCVANSVYPSLHAVLLVSSSARGQYTYSYCRRAFSTGVSILIADEISAVFPYLLVPHVMAEKRLLLLCQHALSQWLIAWLISQVENDSSCHASSLYFPKDSRQVLHLGRAEICLDDASFGNFHHLDSIFAVSNNYTNDRQRAGDLYRAMVSGALGS